MKTITNIDVLSSTRLNLHKKWKQDLKYERYVWKVCSNKI